MQKCKLDNLLPAIKEGSQVMPAYAHLAQKNLVHFLTIYAVPDEK